MLLFTAIKPPVNTSPPIAVAAVVVSDPPEIVKVVENVVGADTTRDPLPLRDKAGPKVESATQLAIPEVTANVTLAVNETLEANETVAPDIVMPPEPPDQVPKNEYDPNTRLSDPP